MHTLSSGCSSQLSVKHGLTVSSSWPSLILHLCHRYLKKGITWPWTLPSLLMWCNGLYCLALGSWFHFSEILCTLLYFECLKTQAVTVATAVSGLVCTCYLHPKGCRCRVAGHFLVWSLFLWYHNSFAPTPCSLTFLWAEIYTQEMENMTFSLCLCVCVISLIWN